MRNPIEALLDLAVAADAWERAYSGSKTADVNTRDEHRVTPRHEMQAAERKLAAAVQKYRGQSK